jgi:hypothetical protein
VALALKQLDVYDAKDGAVASSELLLPHISTIRKLKKRPGAFARVQSVILEALEPLPALTEFHTAHPFLVPMLASVAMNRLHVPKKVTKQLEDLTANDGEAIGGNLCAALVSNTTPEAAVAEWIESVPALRQLEEGQVWFRPLVVVLARDILKRSSVAWVRLYMGAGLSMLDMASDTNTIRLYLGDPDTAKYGKIMLAMLAGNLSMQLLSAWGNTRKGPRREMAKEFLIVLLALKVRKRAALHTLAFTHTFLVRSQPGVDAWRVARGERQKAYNAITPEMDLTYTKTAEMVFESIPGCVIQLVQVIESLQKGNVAETPIIGSIVISALSTGFSSATISYDFDTGVSRRLNEPEFYGFVPAGMNGTVVFGCMVMNSALLLLLRSFSTAQLLLTDSNLFAYYTLGDFFIFFSWRAARNDLQNFSPQIDFRWQHIFADGLSSILAKLIADFTGLVQWRGPGILGGAYFTFNMVRSIDITMRALTNMLTLVHACSSLLSAFPSPPTPSTTRAPSARAVPCRRATRGRS